MTEKSIQENITRNNIFVLDLNIENIFGHYTSSITNALQQADIELQTIHETIDSVNVLKPECDKIDYILSASSGALCGIMDIFLIGKPGESPLGNITDTWFANRTQDFAKICGWKGPRDNSDPLNSAICFLEKHFKVPYDQRGIGDAGKAVYGLNPSNHHFKNLAHNPTLLGLFFSILDQFTNQSHFVSDGKLISLQNTDEKIELHGFNIPSKLFCAVVNWFSHIMSDLSGASSTKGRGMGIPSPLWTWMNDIITIKSQMGVSITEFDKSINELAEQIFLKGFDARFQTTQLIPVLVNELIVRFLYATRRLINYFNNTPKESRSVKLMWNTCKPFSNPTIRRMLTVAHGTFCLFDIGDATIRSFTSNGGEFNPIEFFLRLNIVGVGRFTISLYGETKEQFKIMKAKKETIFALREKTIVENYIEGLKKLSNIYDDQELVNFTTDLNDTNKYIEAFKKSSFIANKRLSSKTLETKEDIDSYFMN